MLLSARGSPAAAAAAAAAAQDGAVETAESCLRRDLTPVQAREVLSKTEYDKFVNLQRDIDVLCDTFDNGGGKANHS